MAYLASPLAQRKYCELALRYWSPIDSACSLIASIDLAALESNSPLTSLRRTSSAFFRASAKSSMRTAFAWRVSGSPGRFSTSWYILRSLRRRVGRLGDLRMGVFVEVPPSVSDGHCVFVGALQAGGELLARGIPVVVEVLDRRLEVGLPERCAHGLSCFVEDRALLLQVRSQPCDVVPKRLDLGIGHVDGHCSSPRVMDMSCRSP